MVIQNSIEQSPISMMPTPILFSKNIIYNHIYHIIIIIYLHILQSIYLIKILSHNPLNLMLLINLHPNIQSKSMLKMMLYRLQILESLLISRYHIFLLLIINFLVLVMYHEKLNTINVHMHTLTQLVYLY